MEKLGNILIIKSFDLSKLFELFSNIQIYMVQFLNRNILERNAQINLKPLMTDRAITCQHIDNVWLPNTKSLL